MGDWSYYDFEKNWDTFYPIWKSDKIQAILNISMKDWVKNPIIRDLGSDTQTIPWAWFPQSCLWKYSPNNYHDLKIRKKVDAIVDRMDLKKKYETAKQFLNENGPPIRSFESTVYSSLYKECSPDPSTLESLVLINGENYLGPTLICLALALFPGADCRLYYNDDNMPCCFCMNERVIIDINKLYMYKYEGKTELNPNIIASEYMNIYM